MSSLRERILDVYRGRTPGVVPYMLDLSHWFYHANRRPWDLSKPYMEPERELIDYHKKVGAGFYIPNLGFFYSAAYPDDVKAEVHKQVVDGEPEITWIYETPLGKIQRVRRWHDHTYSWAIKEWGVKTEQDIKVLGYALSNFTYTAHWDRYRAWVDAVGDDGVVYLPVGYSGMGQLLNYWMGVEGALMAQFQWPETVREVVDRINDNLLNLIDLVATSPAEVIMQGDNFSSDIQPPAFFEQWSKSYYREAARRIHAAGKYFAVHIDGRLRGAIGMIRDTDADCGDAITPWLTGDLTMEECRDEAGEDFILSGGVAPDLWLPGAPIDRFEAAVRRWLDLRKRSVRLIAGAGDQVPPDAEESRIERMRDLVEKHGRY